MKLGTFFHRIIFSNLLVGCASNSADKWTTSPEVLRLLKMEDDPSFAAQEGGVPFHAPLTEGGVPEEEEAAVANPSEEERASFPACVPPIPAPLTVSVGASHPLCDSVARFALEREWKRGGGHDARQAARLGRLRECVETELKEDSHFEGGTFGFKLTVDACGRVTEAVSLTKDPRNHRLLRCFAFQALTIRYPLSSSPEGATSASIFFTVVIPSKESSGRPQVVESRGSPPDQSPLPQEENKRKACRFPFCVLKQEMDYLCAYAVYFPIGS
ncbi:hypothetical protein [Pajaroellobacter abortibovis]|uniref:TonB C-terminal domain-containing protein n=1 Tax=Pajaroellobacter abortibovis TaxID=1882918 RepID=A0A1L6MWD6_9BACT|nr:hypothetical protein [Pajaroellobacter abortibovis]APR99860.1 hypothetical protein BCY86_03590 [Pajaroellobacter abortibovis]